MIDSNTVSLWRESTFNYIHILVCTNIYLKHRKEGEKILFNTFQHTSPKCVLKSKLPLKKLGKINSTIGKYTSLLLMITF